jgi:hypothetical protein
LEEKMNTKEKFLIFRRAIALVTLWIFLFSSVSFALRPQSAKDRIPSGQLKEESAVETEELERELLIDLGDTLGVLARLSQAPSPEIRNVVDRPDLYENIYIDLIAGVNSYAAVWKMPPSTRLRRGDVLLARYDNGDKAFFIQTADDVAGYSGVVNGVKIDNSGLIAYNTALQVGTNDVRLFELKKGGGYFLKQLVGQVVALKETALSVSTLALQAQISREQDTASGYKQAHQSAPAPQAGIIDRQRAEQLLTPILAGITIRRGIVPEGKRADAREIIIRLRQGLITSDAANQQLSGLGIDPGIIAAWITQATQPLAMATGSNREYFDDGKRVNKRVWRIIPGMENIMENRDDPTVLARRMPDGLWQKVRWPINFAISGYGTRLAMREAATKAALGAI